MSVKISDSRYAANPRNRLSNVYRGNAHGLRLISTMGRNSPDHSEPIEIRPYTIAPSAASTTTSTRPNARASLMLGRNRLIRQASGLHTRAERILHGETLDGMRITEPAARGRNGRE